MPRKALAVNTARSSSLINPKTFYNACHCCMHGDFMRKEQSITNLPEAVSTIKSAILRSQYLATSSANQVQLALYYSVGAYVSQNTRNGRWGTSAIKQISETLQKELPGLRGFSERNIKLMRQFFEEWSFAISGSNSAVATAELANLDEFRQFQGFSAISFTHHINILTGAKSRQERLFYIKESAKNSWSIENLKLQIKADAFHHQGKMSSNFEKTLGSPQSALKAISMFKDEYLLDFMNVEELNERDKSLVNERVVEQGIIHNVKNFIMTFGKDFSFVGNQFHLEKFGEDQYIDLLFFNRELNALVAVELKTGDFKPSYLGQLNTYLRILDDDVRKPHEEPSFGIILCKDANKAFVEYVIQDYAHPMGVATYKTMQEKLQKVLPNEDELKKLLNKG